MAKIKKSAGDRYLFQCPACNQLHFINSSWDFNGNYDRPTINPSILVRGTKPTSDEEAERIMRGEKIKPIPHVCHSFIRDGTINYLGDCTHNLAGKTVELPDLDD